jgi:flavorubredoxin
MKDDTAVTLSNLAGEWLQFGAWLPLGDAGYLPNNSFLLQGPSPMLVDTGARLHGQAWFDSLERRVELEALEWLWISHVDQDHIGNLPELLHRAKRMTVLAAPLALAKLDLAGINPERVRLLAEGEMLDIGGHRLEVLKPPFYDAPETLGFFDHTDGLMFVADSFGTPFTEPRNTIHSVENNTLLQSMRAWGELDVPWIPMVDRSKLFHRVSNLSARDPEYLLSSHLPVTRNRLVDFAANLVGE